MQPKFKIVLSIIFNLLFFCALAQSSQKQTLLINNIKIVYTTYNLDQRKDGTPVIIFEAGFGSGGGSFGSLPGFLPTNMPYVMYDRNGLGESGIDSSIHNDNNIAERLHSLLELAKIKPPYLLVGHSLGGPLIRLYTALYPNEVKGLFFIDPTDFMLTQQEDNLVKKNTHSATGYQDIWRINMKSISQDTSVSAGVRNDATMELKNSSPVFFKSYQSLPALNNIPVTVMISYNKPIEHYDTELNTKLKLGINILPWWKALDQLRITHYATMIEKNKNSRLILLPGYSHGIHQQDPQLVAKALIDTYLKCVVD